MTGSQVGFWAFSLLALFTVGGGYWWLVHRVDHAEMRRAGLLFLWVFLGAFYIAIGGFCAFMAWLCHTGQFP